MTAVVPLEGAEEVLTMEVARMTMVVVARMILDHSGLVVPVPLTVLVGWAVEEEAVAEEVGVAAEEEVAVAATAWSIVSCIGLWLLLAGARGQWLAVMLCCAVRRPLRLAALAHCTYIRLIQSCLWPWPTAHTYVSYHRVYDP